MPGAQRDPLSIQYDRAVRGLMIRAGYEHNRRNRPIQAWISSPRSEFRARDKGGRTAHERAFSRSAYYLIFKNGGNSGRSGWSLKLEWGDDSERRASSAGRLARPVRVRLFASGGSRKSAPSWMDDPARRSMIGADGERIVGG